MRKVLLLLIAASALALVVQRLWVGLASDATRIRWRLETMQEGFNDTHLRAVLRGVSDDWRDAEARVGRDELADGLRSLFFHEKDPASGRFPYRVELEETTVRPDPEGNGEARARVEFTARFDALEDGDWTPTWSVRVEARFEEHPERGWQMVHSEHRTLESDGRFGILR